MADKTKQLELCLWDLISCRNRLRDLDLLCIEKNIEQLTSIIAGIQRQIAKINSEQRNG